MADDVLPTRLQFELATPERLLVRDWAVAVSVPGREGYLGILPGHAPLLSELKPGELTYTQDGSTHYLAVGGGFVEVLPDRVTVLADTAERAEEIDLPRAQQARRRAEDELKKSADATVDGEPAQAALARAMARLAVAARRGETRKEEQRRIAQP